VRWVLVNGTKRIKAVELRRALGTSRIRSTDFSVTREGNAFEFTGRGWGHGVGMCQWGAYGMALKGARWQEILAHYYPGAQVLNVAARR